MDADKSVLHSSENRYIITRDRGFADPRSWSEAFTTGVIFVNPSFANSILKEVEDLTFHK